MKLLYIIYVNIYTQMTTNVVSYDSLFSFVVKWVWIIPLDLTYK